MRKRLEEAEAERMMMVGVGEGDEKGKGEGWMGNDRISGWLATGESAWMEGSVWDTLPQSIITGYSAMNEGEKAVSFRTVGKGMERACMLPCLLCQSHASRWGVSTWIVFVLDGMRWA